MNSVSDSVEYPENSAPDHSATGEAYQSVEPERRKDHQTISTAIYYQDDRRISRHGSEEAEDWETDGETGDA
jgi:hypothetical protein